MMALTKREAAARRKLPAIGYGEQVCLCGHRIQWFIKDPPDTAERKLSDLDKLERELVQLGIPAEHIEADTIERPCPHGNGTFIQYCPKCGKKTGMCGVGAGGAIECECWRELNAIHTYP